MPQQPPNPDPGARPAALRGSSHPFPLRWWLVAIVFDALFVFLVYRHLHGKVQWYVADWVVWGVVGMFALPGLFLTGLALFDTVRFARYRLLRLELHPLPATAGSLMAGVLDVPVPYDPAHRYAVRLEAIEHRRGTSARHTMPRVKYQEDFEAGAAPGTQGTQLRFDLRMPAGAPPSQGYGEAMRWTRATQKRVYLRWTLRIFARTPGVDLKEEFEIPVRRATAAEAAFAAASPPTARGPALPPMPSGSPSYVSAQVGGRWVIRQPPWRKPGTPPSHALGLMAYFGVFLLGGFLFVGIVFDLPPWVPYAVGGLLVGSGVIFARRVLVAAASELRVEVSRFDGLLIHRSVWGLRLKHVVLERGRIASVDVLGGPPSWSVEVREHSGKVHCLAESIVTAREAEALRDEIIARLGLVASAEAGQAARAAAAAAERRFRRRGSVATTAIVLGSVGLLAAAYLLVPDWYLVKKPAQVATQVAPQSVPQTALAPPTGVDRALSLASRAESTEGTEIMMGRRTKVKREPNVHAAIGHLLTATRVAREENGEAHPLEAYVLYQLAQAQLRAHAPGGAKESLDAAMRIMERHRPEDARRMLGKHARHFDLELLASYGGRMLWEQRRYADAHAYYLKAWEADLGVEVSEVERNLRRGTASAGVMATACTLGNWELADKAMAELKEHYRRASPNANGALKYWIDTGEPRLKARKC